VRIGIEAPSDVRIFRHEIWEAAAQENRAAAETSVDELPSPKKTS
jgi:carbon storage regulator CsrA